MIAPSLSSPSSSPTHSPRSSSITSTSTTSSAASEASSTAPALPRRPPRSARRQQQTEQEQLPAYTPRSDPPTYVDAATTGFKNWIKFYLTNSCCTAEDPCRYPEPPTITRCMFFLGFFCPLFWVFGAYVRSPYSFGEAWRRMRRSRKGCSGCQAGRMEDSVVDGSQGSTPRANGAPIVTCDCSSSVAVGADPELGEVKGFQQGWPNGTPTNPSWTVGEERELDRRRRIAAEKWAARCMFALVFFFVILLTVGLSVYGSVTAARHK